MVTDIILQLERTAELYCDKIMYSDSSQSITFGRTLELAKRLGSALAAKRAVRSGVAVMTGRNVYTPAVFLGIVCAGCFYAPMDASQPEARLRSILEVLDSDILIADRENIPRAEKLGFKGEILCAEELFESDIDEALLCARRADVCADDPLYVIFTSGSTGKPKGVITSSLSLCCYIESYADVMGIDDSDVLGNQSPLDYIAAIRDIYLPVFRGASMFIIPKQCFVMPAELFAVLNEQKITSVGWSVSVFTIAVKVGAFEGDRPRYLKKVCFSGSVMPSNVLRVWQENLPDTLFVNQYGPTECTASCTYHRIDHIVSDDEELPIGRHYKNYRVFLLNDDDTPTQSGEMGEICVSGPIVALGYYNNKELTEKSFVQNPLNKAYSERMYRTGDHGIMREDGVLLFRGRKDRQIKHLGHRVELSEIETAALRLDSISEACAMYQKEKELIWLFYSGSATAKEATVHLRQIIPGFMVPRKLVALETIPHLSNGKVDMQTLKATMEK